MGTVIYSRPDTARTGCTPTLHLLVYRRQKCKQIQNKQFQSVVCTIQMTLSTVSIGTVNLATAHHHFQSTQVFLKDSLDVDKEVA